MSEQRPPDGPQRPLLRIFAAGLIGLVGSAAIWVASPYNTWVMGSQFIADSYLPVAALFLVLVLVLLVNPLLRKLLPSLTLTTWQLALITAILLMASVLPSSGLLRQLPSAVANVPLEVSKDKKVAQAYEEMDLPPGLFPDKTEYKAEVPASEDYIRELPKGESIPWEAWVGPLVWWGTFVLFCWLMMIGLSLIVLPQWRQNERLPFPLLTVERSLIEEPNPGKLLAPLFRTRSFWVAAGIVFALRLLAGLKEYYPQDVPAIPMTYNLGPVFAGTFFGSLPGHIRHFHMYFIFVGIAFFMPTRISFSIWFFQLAYGLYDCIRWEYFPDYQRSQIYDHRIGAMFVLTAFIVWLGRKHWAHVFRCIFRAKNEEERKNRNAALMFSAGLLGMWFWMIHVGVQWGWALFYVFIAFMVSLLITRIVAETGMPFVRIDFRYNISLVKMAPFSWVSPVSLYFATVIAMLFPTASRVSASAMGAHALDLDEAARPRWRSRLAWSFVVLTVVGLILSGGTHIMANYHHGITLDGESRPLNAWGSRRITGPAHPDLKEYVDNKGKEAPSFSQPDFSRPWHLGFGAALAGICEWACLRMPRWPLHPVGLIMVQSYYANQAWFSVLVGWLAKVLLVGFGGARLYRLSRAAFLGLIMGDVFAAIFWSIEPAVRHLIGLEYKAVHLLPT
ncbi:MAG: DUF6785 family protein [Planctomycetota bacterium]